MTRSAVLNLRIEPEIKTSAEELFGSFGLSVTDAVTQAAIQESETLISNPNAKTFISMEALKADLMSDDDDV